MKSSEMAARLRDILSNGEIDLVSGLHDEKIMKHGKRLASVRQKALELIVNKSVDELTTILYLFSLIGNIGAKADGDLSEKEQKRCISSFKYVIEEMKKFGY